MLPRPFYKYETDLPECRAGHTDLTLIALRFLHNTPIMTASDLEKMGPSHTSTNNKAPSTSESGMTKSIVDSKADVALQYLAEHGRVEYTAEEERVVRGRIDWFLLPVVRYCPSRAPKLGLITLTLISPYSYPSLLDSSISTR